VTATPLERTLMALDRLRLAGIDADTQTAGFALALLDARAEARAIVRAGLMPLLDGYADDAEFLADVACADCGWTRADAARCEGCNATGCRCEITASRDLCDRYSGGDLCEECIAVYTCSGRCPDCDPPDPRDH
jgi:hypothetical protein